MDNEPDCYVDTISGRIRVMSKLSEAEKKLWERITIIIAIDGSDRLVYTPPDVTGLKIIGEIRKHIEEIMEDEERLGHVRARKK